jgi:energy-coupling factor transport system substrate-specific component
MRKPAMLANSTTNTSPPASPPRPSEGSRQVGLGFGRQELILTVVGLLLYAVITWFTSFMKLQATSDVDLRPSVVIPMLFGFAAGPWVGFLSGILGNAISDHFLYGSGVADWQWSAGVGMMGLVPGLFAATGLRSYRGWLGQLQALAVATLGLALGMGFAAFIALWLCSASSTLKSCYVIPTTFGIALNNSFLPAFKVNFISTVLLLPIVLFNLERLSFRAEDWRSGLFRRLALAIVTSAALPTGLLGFFLLQRFSGEKGDGTILFQIGGTIIFSLLFTVANAGILARSFSRPLLELAKAAQAMRDGHFSKAEAEELRENSASDEISQLSQVFGSMAADVIAREDNLKQQVEELRIEIDESKRQKQVADIIESDFFRELRSKATNLRARSRSGGSGGGSSEGG